MFRKGLIGLFAISDGFFVSRTTRWLISLGLVLINVRCWFRTARSASSPDNPAVFVFRLFGFYTLNSRKLSSKVGPRMGGPNSLPNYIS